jgi:hypothetical protein
MHRAVPGLALLICMAALAALAQAPQPPAGLDTDWDIAVILGEIGAHAGRLLPALDRIDVSAWTAKGASETYAAQLESGKQQAKAIEQGAKTLAADPEKLADGLELFFRIEGLETILSSLEEGIRKYRTPEEAQALISQEAENGVNRDRVRRYLVNLAADRERQLKMMDQEAQRCRAAVSAAPAPAPSNSGRKK